MNHQIEVDITNASAIRHTLQNLLIDFDDICVVVKEHQAFEFGQKQAEDFVAYSTHIHDDVPPFSELTFFMAAAAHESLQPMVLKFLQAVINKNSEQTIWVNEELPMGLNAAFALANTDKQYIPHFIQFLRTCDMNHEVYQPYFIDILLQKWDKTEESLLLLASRGGSISGQFGFEGIKLPSLSIPQKEFFFTALLEDALHAKATHADLLYDALEELDIEVNEEKFMNLFQHIHPTYQLDTIPNLKSVQ